MMLDSISQRLLQPIHDWLYGLLGLLLTDGTFSQLSPLERLKGKQECFSFDLKSATDRVPAEECSVLLATLFGPEVSSSWRCLLYRSFVVPKSLNVHPVLPRVTFVTGTPLGSLSAWAVFTLLHHLVVQQAAYYIRKTRDWFSDYAILGDDLIIADRKVAKQYRRILKRIDVQISAEKSISSMNGSMEFASRFVYKGNDVSGVSFKTLAAGQQSIVQMPAFFLRLEEFRETRISEFFRLKGAGYRTLPLATLPFWSLWRLPKRWLKVWLVYKHPKGAHPIPWLWWLSAGRKRLVPPEAIGVLHYQLLDEWYSGLSGDGWTTKDSQYDNMPFWEDLTRAPWLSLYLSQLGNTARRLIAGELIDPILDYVKVKDDLARLPPSSLVFDHIDNAIGYYRLHSDCSFHSLEIFAFSLSSLKKENPVFA